MNIVWHLLDWFRLGEAERYLTASMRLAEEAEFLGFLSYVHVARARLEFCSRVVGTRPSRLAESYADASLPVRCSALTVFGRVLVRRGAAGGCPRVGSAWELAVKVNELQRTGPVAAARAEAAWLRGDHAGAGTIAAPAYQEAGRLGDQVYRAELGFWLAKAGVHVQPDGDHPYAVQAAGRWRQATAIWEAAGCPYEHAAALAESPEPQHLLTPHCGMLAGLARERFATMVRRRLRGAGVTGRPARAGGRTKRESAA